MTAKKLWLGLTSVMFFSFAVLGYYGYEIYFQAPPVPKQVVTKDGEVIYTGKQIHRGRQVWQAMGGQEVGSVWGHGAYVAPDWSADWLHREATNLLEIFAQDELQTSFEKLPERDQDILKARLKREMRRNTYDKDSQTITIGPERRKAIEVTASHYKALFSDSPELNDLREAYAITSNMVKGEENLEALSAFFFWASWATTTKRPGKEVTYTQNWPPEELVGNVPTSEMLLWTGFSVMILLFGIGVLAFYYARENHELPAPEKLPTSDPLLEVKVTPSMRATLKYFWIVTALILFQVLMGVVTAHYGVEGNEFYNFPLSNFLPYSVSRTWHIQLGIFWIATSWLATGLYISPVVSGHEPKFQRLGVNILFIALLVIVVGSSYGQWASVMHKIGVDTSFWFGHQGLEYVDLGRFWQIFLFLGLWIWLALMARAIWPALKSRSTQGRHLLILFLISSTAIALFYGAGLMWGRETNYAMVEYWRWWVVHLWVEGFFEVFATVVIAFIFVRMKLLNEHLATHAVLFSTVVFLFGGILGTFHHLYFSGTPIGVMAIGASFSALEVVPLVLIGFEAYQNIKLGRATEWVRTYRWPIYCFISVAFWNFLGAGIFGFLINPPIALYYMQGLNTTPVHGHTALFGVYGFLGIGLTLFCLKGLGKHLPWNDKTIGFALWSINIGLALMVFISVLPVGFMQTLASFEHGLWYARSAEFLQTKSMDFWRWMRVIGDTIFAIGAVVLTYFVFGLRGGWSYKK